MKNGSKIGTNANEARSKRELTVSPLAESLFAAVGVQPNEAESQTVEAAIWMLASLSGTFKRSELAMMEGTALVMLLLAPEHVQTAAKRMMAQGAFMTRERVLKWLQTEGDGESAGTDCRIEEDRQPTPPSAVVRKLMEGSDSIYLSTVRGEASLEYFADVRRGKSFEIVQDENFQRFWHKLAAVKRTCRGCKEAKEIGRYTLDTQGPGGYDAFCRDCKTSQRKGLGISSGTALAN